MLITEILKKEREKQP